MSGNWIIAPVLLPLLSAVLMMLLIPLGLNLQRSLSLAATVALFSVTAILLSSAAGGEYQTYHLGNWPAPFGIVLVLDRLSALMLVLTALVALGSLCYGLGGTDAKGAYFHILFQFQLFGLNGAFLTGDLFNLFVFFEVLLIASYGLLLHGGGVARTRAGLHYVVLNLVGSTLFLVALGLLYGAAGTLNTADLALKVTQSDPQYTALLRAGALLLLVVFGLKAALMPLYFWLPRAYSSTSAPVAALFAIMTKVGVYAIIRVFTLAFGPGAGDLTNVAEPWLLPAALTTLAAGSLGLLASRDLKTLIAYSVVVSIGTLLTAVGLFSIEGLNAALVYLIHTTLVTAGMFLLADVIGRERGSLEDRPHPPLLQPLIPGVLFFLGAIALAGMPPLSGFLAKLLILEAAQQSTLITWVWSIVLSTSLLTIAALVRMGGALFWKTADVPSTEGRVNRLLILPAAMLLLCSPTLMLIAGPLTEFTSAAAHQLSERTDYLESVLGSRYVESFLPSPEEAPR